MTTIDVRTFTCLVCEEAFDLDNDGGDYSVPSDGWLCQGCVDSDSREASSAYFIPKGEWAEHYDVTDHFIYTPDGENAYNYPEPPLTRRYVSTDGWRGYYETKPVGAWQEVTTGWTTGNWGDSIANSKQEFNRWTQRLIEGRTDAPCDVWIIFDPTSNVFSTAVGVFVPEDVEPFDIPSL